MKFEADRKGTSGYQIMATYGFVVSMFLVRPSHLGENVNFIGLVMLMFSSAFASFSPDWRPNFKTIMKPAMLLVMWVFLFFHSVLNGVDSPLPAFSTMSAIFIFITSLFLLSSELITRRATTYFIYVLVFFGFSGIVTLVLTPIFGFTSLYLFKIQSKVYESPGDIMFPLTMTYELKAYAWGLFARMSFFWREAGIAQAIYVWGLGIVLFTPGMKYRTWLIVGLVAGNLLTQSTLAYGDLLFVVAVWYLSRAKLTPFNLFVVLPIAIVAGGVLIYLSIFDENIGFVAKSSGASFTERYYATQAGIDMLMNNPLGIGVYAKSADYNVGVNLISASGFLGIFGLILTFITFMVPIFVSKNRLVAFVCIAPMIFTAVTSEALFDCFGMWLLLFIDPAVLTGPSLLKRRRAPVLA